MSTHTDSKTEDQTREVTVLHRGEPVRLTVPAGREYVIDLRLVEPLALPAQLPDLALEPGGLAVSATGVAEFSLEVNMSPPTAERAPAML